MHSHIDVSWCHIWLSSLTLIKRGNMTLVRVFSMCVVGLSLTAGCSWQAAGRMQSLTSASRGLSISRYLLLVCLLSAQCISSIGQIIKSVCVSVSQWVSGSVCHTKRVERSTDRNLPPIFTKHGTKVETQEMWLPIVFGGNPKYFYPPNRKWK